MKKIHTVWIMEWKIRFFTKNMLSRGQYDYPCLIEHSIRLFS